MRRGPRAPRAPARPRPAGGEAAAPAADRGLWGRGGSRAGALRLRWRAAVGAQLTAHPAARRRQAAAAFRQRHPRPGGEEASRRPVMTPPLRRAVSAPRRSSDRPSAVPPLRRSAKQRRCLFYGVVAGGVTSHPAHSGPLLPNAWTLSGLARAPRGPLPGPGPLHGHTLHSPCQGRAPPPPPPPHRRNAQQARGDSRAAPGQCAIIGDAPPPLDHPPPSRCPPRRAGL
jgi:hypothetical protein